MFTLREVATACGPAFGIERLGGNVYAVTDFRFTVTINGGQLASDGPADLLITDAWTGAILFTGEVAAADEVPLILATLA